jgi:membrane-anchored mycosin MYCP
VRSPSFRAPCAPSPRALSGLLIPCCLIIALAVAPVPLAATPASAQTGCGPVGDLTLERTPWPIRRLDPVAAWHLTRGAGVVVAVIDSGVSAEHPTLAGKVLPGQDFDLPHHSGQCDEVGHGTLVAALIAGRDGTGAPFSGIAPDASVLPARVLQDDGHSTDPELPGRVARAIRWAADSGADVINLSLETVRTDELAEAVRYAVDRDVVLVAAAGNVADGQHRGPAYPAAFDEVIAVAGIDEEGGHVDSSVRGNYLALAAPGTFIEGPAPRGDGYRLVPEGGTSYATAYVSGVVALVRAHHPDLPAPEVARRITLTADRPPDGHNDQVGHGVVNPYRAVAAVLGTRTNPPLATALPAELQSDPLAGQKAVAVWSALAGAVVALVLLISRPVVRRGRQRGWGPPAGRRLSGQPAAPARSLDHRGG